MTKLFIQTNLNKVSEKIIKCDVTIVADIATVATALTVAKYTKSINDGEFNDFSNRFKDQIDLFQGRCSCKKYR